MAKHYYVICKKKLFGVQPIKVLTNQLTAQKFCQENKGHIILHQKGDENLEKMAIVSNVETPETEA